jgi:hypothetical protein
MPVISRTMPPRTESHRADTLGVSELELVLARAFDRAWARYYRPGRTGITPDVARTALAKHLVQMAKDGVADEGELAAGGVLYLFSITLDGDRNLSA